ncbi:MAG: hypothetical protein AAGA93_15345 [Actinomycetota bacterium]
MSADPDIGLHRRQYVVGARPHRLGPGWSAIVLPSGLVVSHCPELPLARATDADGITWLLLGLAGQTRPDRPDPVDELATSPTAAVGRVVEGWAGRWTLIGNGELHPDATAQLTCHWMIDDDGSVLASSSPAILGELSPEHRDEPRDLVYERGLSWVVPPLGTLDGARRLLPSQRLDLIDRTARWRRLVVPPAELTLARLDDETAMTAFVEAVGQAMLRAPGDGPRHLGLTAGADSRLVLAAALAAGVDIAPYTRISARMSVADRVVPPRLAAAVGLDHRRVSGRPADPDRLRLARAHTGGHVSDGDALPFVEGVRDHFTGIEFGGQGLGVGKVKERVLPAEIDDPAALSALLADHVGEPAGTVNRSALTAWLTSVAEHQDGQDPADRVDWRDRFYIEQRLAGWQAAKEQLYDLNRHHRMIPINSARTIGLLLAVDPERRRTGDHRRQLIALADERLLAEPFNPPGATFGLATQLAHGLAVDRVGLVRRVRRRLRRA